MNNKNKRNSLAIIGFSLLCTILGGLLGFSMIQVFGDGLLWWQTVLRIVEGVVLFFVAFFLQVILHEIGHMVAALSRGWSFIHFMILGVVLSRRNGKFHLSSFAIPGVGGQCLMMPPEKGETDFGIAFYNAGGVLMNVVVSLLVAVLLGLFFNQLVWDVTVFLFSLGFTGLLFAFINGIPMVSGGVPNDGKNIQELKKDRFSTHVFLTMMRVMGELQQGKSVSEVYEGYITEGVKIDYSNPIHQAAVNFDLSHAIARKDFEKAHAVMDEIERNFDEFVPIYRKEITYESVFLYLVSPREGVDVELLIDSDTLKYFEMQTNFRPTALRVKYAFARLYECNEEKAKVVYDAFQKVCMNYHVQGEVITEKILMEYVKGITPAESYN